MTPDDICPDCGEIVPADAPRGLCPACLMGADLFPEFLGRPDGTGRCHRLVRAVRQVCALRGRVARRTRRDPGRPPSCVAA